MSFLSICIPTYEMKGNGVKFLEYSFKKLTNQTFKNFEIVISDHSSDEEIKNLCVKYKDILNIVYFKNIDNVGNSSANVNNAIKHASGKIIKFLFQDDFLYNEDSLEITVSNFDFKKDKWLVSRCEHSIDGISFFRDFKPHYNENIHLGINTISSPSVLTVLNDEPFLFDENLICLMDCDYYKRCFQKYGEPKILNVITVVNRVGDHQVSNTIVNAELQIKELKYIKEKFND
jgi:glycosyltransferase involved in cell wall biosynthesis